MARFSVGVVSDSHGGRNIGYKVTSNALGAGLKMHLRLLGGEWARQACEEYAAALETEAATVPPERASASRAVAALLTDIKRRVAENAERNAATKAAKISARGR